MASESNGQSQSGSYSELARLSAVETLKALSRPDEVTLDELVRFLSAKGMWDQFATVTLDDLKRAFTPTEATKKRKRRLIADEFADEDGRPPPKKERAPADGGLETEDIARQILPFVEGNGEVALDDLAEYTRLDRRVLRHHLGVLVKAVRFGPRRGPCSGVARRGGRFSPSVRASDA
jgi:DNA-binding transcriptional ArsR family regulator